MCSSSCVSSRRMKGTNKLKAKPKEEAAPAKPSEEVVLLSEIRDELKKMGPSSL